MFTVGSPKNICLNGQIKLIRSRDTTRSTQEGIARCVQDSLLGEGEEGHFLHPVSRTPAFLGIGEKYRFQSCSYRKLELVKLFF